MEFVEGMNLAQLVEKTGPLPIANACHFARQAALGLQHAFEQGMVHRDVKPQNLMVTPKGILKILDFGLARMRSEQKRGAGLTQADAFMGTPAYVAPEQLERDGEGVDPLVGGREGEVGRQPGLRVAAGEVNRAQVAGGNGAVGGPGRDGDGAGHPSSWATGVSMLGDKQTRYHIDICLPKMLQLCENNVASWP